ncbi:MAG: large subunit ribosomal protein L35Ae [Candidatus Woesearchaeota archaeon]|nr:large subunit ribosomal protein L35Ae [Candidatus Woesearchaeota archaeon]MDN5327741.1 large subunit ribosomal protein L35Ae [Candidatus Woesearchaeota archaeon]
MIVVVDNVNSREEAEKLVGKTVIWKSPANKEIKGKVASAHGNKGAVRVIFETGMPGQAVGTKVSIN